MIKILHLPGTIQITLTPNRSLTWRQTLIVMSVFGSFCLAIALVWALLGAWFILPFAGIEIGLLAFVMYLVSKKTYTKQTLLVNEQYLSFYTGQNSASTRVLFPRKKTKLITYEVYHPEDVKELYLVACDNKQRIGEFLNLDDQAKLLLQLAKCGIHPREIENTIEIQL